MKKRLLSALLALVMVLSLLPTAALAASFTDTEGHWAVSSIDRWANYGVFNGVGDGTFLPDKTITRAEAAQIFVNLMKLTETADISGYTDVSAGEWYHDAMSKCVAAGIINGTGSNSLSPYGLMTREQLFTMLGRALGVKPAASSSTGFTDSGQIGSWAVGYINALADMGVLQGVGDGRLAPLDDINRASVAAAMDRAIGTYITSSGTYSAPSSGVILIVGGSSVTLTGNVDGTYITVSDSDVGIDLSATTGSSYITVTDSSENVTITGADAGTTVSAPGDSNTTVNGSDASGGGEYVVPGSGGGTGGGGGGGSRPTPTPDPEPPEEIDYGLAEEVEDGSILHTWCWSFNTIKEKIPTIAAAGYSAVQTSPICEVKQAKDGGMELWTSGDDTGHWWWHYQPTNYDDIGNFHLGTEEEFKEMVKVAHAYGVKVIVDQVINHTTSDYDAVSDDIKNRDWSVDANGDPVDVGPYSYSNYPNGGSGKGTDAWRHYDVGWANSPRYKSIAGYLSNLIDWNTHNPNVQEYMLDWLVYCVEAGADGFRFDAAHHIELPTDTADIASDFWPIVLQNGASFQYGEVLSSGNWPGYQALTFTAPNGTEKHFGVTNASYGSTLRSRVSSKNVSVNNIRNMGDGSEYTVTWVESHDNYCNEGSYNALNDQQVIQAWAILSARKDGTPLFFSRPNNATASDPWGDNLVGPAGNPFYYDPQVAAVNFFRIDMNGLDETLTNPISGNNQVVMIERGDKGAVIVNTGNSTVTLDGAASVLADGTYTDQVDGGTFTVAGGKISGTVAAGQVAVVYNPEFEGRPDLPDLPAAVYLSHPTSDFVTDTLDVTVTLRSVDHAAYQLDDGAANPVKNGDVITVGADLAIGESVTLTVIGYDAANEEVARASATYTKKEYREDTVIYVADGYREAWGWDGIGIHAWTSSANTEPWPGIVAVRQTEGEWAGYWKAVLPDKFEGMNNINVIVNTGTELSGDGVYQNDVGRINWGDIKVLTADERWIDASDLTPDEPSNDASITGIKIGNVNAKKGEDNSWTAELPFGSELPDAEDIEVTAAKGATYEVTGPEDGVYTITVTAEDGETTATYTLTVTVATEPSILSSDAEIVSIDVIGFEAEEGEDGVWTAELPSGSRRPAAGDIEFEVSEGATYTAEGPEDGVYTITVTAEDGDTTEEYTLTVTVEKVKTVVYVQDGYKGWEEIAVHAWWESNPTVVTTDWPGVVAELQTTGNWKGYWRVELPEFLDGEEISVIINNNNNGQEVRVGTMNWGDIKVATNDGKWIDADDVPVQLTEYGLAEDIEGGSILHAWCWNFETIRDMIPYIAAAGFSAVQTSPINLCIVGNSGRLVLGGGWYYHYQPTEYLTIGNYQLGTAAQFEEMVEVAHSYGVKVIVDQVLNHMTSSTNSISDAIRNGDWGNPGRWGSTNGWQHKSTGTQWHQNDRFEETQNELSSLREWNTQNPRVQRYLLTWLQTCVEAGADGFRYDAAKLIELPDDVSNKHPERNVAYGEFLSDFASNFWPVVLKNGSSFQYGEDLQECEPDYLLAEEAIDPDFEGSGYDDHLGSRLGAYQGQTFTAPNGDTKYMNTTLSFYGYRLRHAVDTGNLAVSYVEDMLVPEGADADRTVTWVESHDSYCNNESYNELDEQGVIQAWAILSAREKGTPLFYSRPMNATAGNMWGNNVLGPEGSHFFMNPQVVAVNFFRIDMDTLPEKLSNPDGNTQIIMIERGDKGAVIVNLTGADYELNVDTVLADGTYTDQAYGGTFTVSGGKLTGTVGNGNVAVVYNPTEEAKALRTLPLMTELYVSPVDGTDFTTDTLDVSVTYIGADHATYKVGDEDQEHEIANGGTFTVGADLEPDQSVTVTVTAYDAEGGVLNTVTATYTKRIWRQDTIVYMDNADVVARNWRTVYVYTWGAKENRGWPGVQAELQTEGEWAGYWKYVFPMDMENLDGTFNVILNNGSGGGSNQFDAGTMQAHQIKVWTADGKWVDASEVVKGEPAVRLAPGDGTSFTTETLNVTLSVANCASAKYQIDDGELTAYEDGTTITVGAGLEAGETVTVTVYGYNEGGEQVATATATYTKIVYKNNATIYIDPAVRSEWTDICIYMYGGSGSAPGWPGFHQSEMTEENGLLKFVLPDDMQGSTWTVIFSNNGANQGQVERDWKIGPDEQKIWKPGGTYGTWEDYTPEDAGEDDSDTVTAPVTSRFATLVYEEDAPRAVSTANAAYQANNGEEGPVPDGQGATQWMRKLRRVRK